MAAGVNFMVAFCCKGHSWNPGMGKDKQMLWGIPLISLVHIVMDHCTKLQTVIGLPKGKLKRDESLKLASERRERQN